MGSRGFNFDPILKDLRTLLQLSRLTRDFITGYNLILTSRSIKYFSNLGDMRKCFQKQVFGVLFVQMMNLLVLTVGANNCQLISQFVQKYPVVLP